MSVIVGYSFWAEDGFQDDSVSLVNTRYLEAGNAIIDELSVRQKTNQGMENVRDDWQNDTILIAKFINSMESGNISSDGNKIVKFRIVRRLTSQSESDDIHLGEVPYSGGDADLEFTDPTQPNQNLIYTIIPVGENDLDGTPRDVTVDSSDSFTGWWVVDKDSGDVLPFDKAIGSVGNVETSLTQTKTILESFSKYPRTYKNPSSYEQFSLSTVILPDELERSGIKYQEILDKFIMSDTPKIVKSDNGRIFVCNISNPRTSTPLNTWSGADYAILTIDLTEISDYSSYMKGE